MADAPTPTRRYGAAVQRILAFARHSVVDALIAALSLTAAFELAVTVVPDDRAIIPFYLLVGPVLFFRRRFPLAAPTLAFALMAAVATIDPGTEDLSAIFFIALLATAIVGGSDYPLDRFRRRRVRADSERWPTST